MIKTSSLSLGLISVRYCCTNPHRQWYNSFNALEQQPVGLPVNVDIYCGIVR
jgi:hypothetical protein